MLELDRTENPIATRFSKPLEICQGVYVPTGPGLGVEVAEEVLGRYRLK